MTSYSALFLGTGASLGVPIIGCNCSVCTSKNPKNHRLRSSLLLTYGEKKVVIDAGPDFREQALRHQINELDGVIFTHAHQDHAGGIDDLRVYHFKNKSAVPALVSKETAEDLTRRFYFMFDPGKEKIALETLNDLKGETSFLGIPLSYFSYHQIGMQVLGFRFGSFAYVTDIKEYSQEIISALSGVKTLVVSALREGHSHMHLTVEEAVDFASQVGADRTFFTHLSHELEYEEMNKRLPSSIRLAYDGLQISGNA